LQRLQRVLVLSVRPLHQFGGLDLLAERRQFVVAAVDLIERDGGLENGVASLVLLVGLVFGEQRGQFAALGGHRGVQFIQSGHDNKSPVADKPKIGE
jgi:hypothetical protein